MRTTVAALAAGVLALWRGGVVVWWGYPQNEQIEGKLLKSVFAYGRIKEKRFLRRMKEMSLSEVVLLVLSYLIVGAITYIKGYLDGME